jgi:hypothetical protein
MVRKSTPARALISPIYTIDLDQIHPGYFRGAYVAETGSHDDSIVLVLLVVVEDFLHRLDTRVLITLIVLSGVLLVPIQNLSEQFQPTQ